MSIAHLAPANTKKARQTAIKSFTKFLAAEDVTLDAAHQLIDTDKTGKVLRIMLDKYAYSLARSTEKFRSTNTCLAYFGNVKNWLLEVYPQQGGIVKPLLQHMLSRLGKYCNNREEGGLEKKAPPCSKQDLETIVRLLYTSDYGKTCYVDATLVVLMWYLYGRSSDAEQLEKQQLSILPGGVIFLRFKRVKTALLQGISLFKDPTSFLTCPVFALATSLLMQTAPCKRLFPQFINNKRGAVCGEDVTELSLVELLEIEEENAPLQAVNKTPANSRIPGAQAYVNRLLSTVKDIAQAKQVKLTPDITSHSFRRGAAMHANDGSLAENWIIERGGWQLDRVNKAFAYMLGTTQADQKVARVLSGWKPKDGARHPSLRALEEPNLSRALKLQALLFANTLGFADPALNLDEELAEVLTATLVMHYPDMLLLADSSAFIVKMRESLTALAIGEAELLAWSVTIRRAFTPSPAPTESHDCSAQYTALVDLLKKQSEQINNLILQNKRIEERLLAVETPKATSERPLSDSRGDTVSRDGGMSEVAQTTVQISRVARPKKKGLQLLSAIWYEWFTAEPRVYRSRSVKKTTLYEFRHIAGYMMLFLPSGFKLDASSPAFKSEVLELGEEAQTHALAFLKANGSSAFAAGTALKALRKLHKAGKLDAHIALFHERVHSGSIVDPTPSSALPSFIRLQPNQKPTDKNQHNPQT